MKTNVESTSRSSNEHATLSASVDRSELLSEYPYLRRVEKLQNAYPALRPLIDKLENTRDQGRQLVTKCYADQSGNSPGRCAVLVFHDDHVEHERTLDSAYELSQYLEDSPPARHVIDRQRRRRRLFILEDMEPGFVDVLGDKLGVNPTIFSEQMNTWNFTDSRSVSFRSLPSNASPQTLFTIRYFELRTMDDEEDPNKLRTRMTCAINRRRFERWRDLKLSSIESDQQHAFVRRCASFWTPCDSEADNWDAVILVDPPLDSCKSCSTDGSNSFKRPSYSCQPSCLMLEDPKEYESHKKLWQSRVWKDADSVKAVPHRSKPYHGGVSTLVRPFLCHDEGIKRTSLLETSIRNQASPFDELVFYWTQCPDREAIAAARQSPVNSAYYLLKFVAASWDNQLEFMSYSVANCGWFKDDHEAGIGTGGSPGNWEAEFTLISSASKDINHMKRKINQFRQAMTLNLERTGMQIGAEQVDATLPVALRHAQKDFLAIYSRLGPLSVRIDDLSSITNELAGLRAAFKSIEDGANNLKLSLFLAIIFPLTLVASMLSMGDDFLPGKRNFWVFWASSVPLAFVIGVAMLYGRILGALDKFRSDMEERKSRKMLERVYGKV